ncbi:hypothetical protein Tco_1234190 [Tanacetum coccineum]
MIEKAAEEDLIRYTNSLIHLICLGNVPFVDFGVQSVGCQIPKNINVVSRDSYTVSNDVTSKRQRAHRSDYGLDLIYGADSVSAEEKDDKRNVHYVYEIDGQNKLYEHFVMAPAAEWKKDQETLKRIHESNESNVLYDLKAKEDEYEVMLSIYLTPISYNLKANTRALYKVLSLTMICSL